MSNRSSISSLGYTNLFERIAIQNTQQLAMSPNFQNPQQKAQLEYSNRNELHHLLAQMKLQQKEAPEPPKMRKGRCKWFNVAKGWGFITPLDGGDDVFVHQSVIQMRGFRSLAIQEEVEFTCEPTSRGLEATRVTGKSGADCRGEPRTRRSIVYRTTRQLRCYNCGQFNNHIAAECRVPQQPKLCYFCRQDNHKLADCPNRKPNPHC